MIDEARVIAVNPRIDDDAAIDDEQEGVVVVSGLGVVRSSASLCEMRSPRYSVMRVPLRILRVAKAPLPCTRERRTLK